MNTHSFVPPEPVARDVITLGFAPMDAIHLEFDNLVKQALNSPDQELPDLIELIKLHLRSHFDAEDRWMTESDFPARDCHSEEHAAVLRSADEVSLRVSAGDMALGRSFATELAKWFPGHADYLDSALAHWMCNRQFGGKPVVFSRMLHDK